ncbi:YolD-like family protein [Brevibacillus ginsengisoli]|uniref:YolD-like family protein n=1 Tax=Brevibacillus ginsengisoli TaxID=363854 RepID=UPI003CF05D31
MASKKDNLFTASRFVLPEHREAILQLQEDQKLVVQPILDEQEMESIHFQVMDSARHDYAVTITWWRHVKEQRGMTCSFEGVVKWIDSQARRIKLENDGEIEWIPIDHITGVRS